MNLYVSLCALAFVIAGAIFWSAYPSYKRRKRFAEREELTLNEIYQQFFSNGRYPKELVLELWSEVAENLGIRAGKLRPTDRFDRELSPERGWEYDDALGILDSVARARLKRLGAELDLDSITTLGDYVAFFCTLDRKGG